MSIATDYRVVPVVVVHHRAERGVNLREGQWVVIRVRRTLYRNGDVAAVDRHILSWHTSEEAAKKECQRLDGGAP